MKNWAPNHSDKRFIELQSLRGIASLMVLGVHTLGYFAAPAWFTTLQALSNGEAAVILFFVLSGFVLINSLMSSDFSSASITKFYVRRLFRIYPALLVASTIGFIYVYYLHFSTPIPGVAEWFAARFRADRMSAVYIIASFAGMLAFILPPVWTIFIEIVASVLMPFIAFLCSRKRPYFWFLLLALATISVVVGPFSYYKFLLYMVDFAVGASICIWPDSVCRWIESLGSSKKWIFALAAACTVGIPFATGGSADMNPWFQLLTACFAAFLVGLIVNGKGDLPILESRSVVWIGDRSYSVYILHFPIMCLIAKGFTLVSPDPAAYFGPVGANLLLFALTVMITLPLSNFSFLHIEKPGIAAGQWLLRNWTALRPARAHLPAISRHWVN